MIRQLERLESCYGEAARLARELVEGIKAGNGALDQDALEKGLELRSKALLSAQDLCGIIAGSGSQARFQKLAPAQRDQAGRLVNKACSQAKLALKSGAELFKLLSEERARTETGIKSARNGQRLMRGYKGFKSTSANLDPVLRG